MSWGMFAAIAGLGVAGLDPVGALILTTAIASGARRSAVLAFFASSLGVTVLVGVALGESVQRLVDVVVSLIQVPDPARFWLQLTAAVALTVWAVRRYRNRNQSSPSQSRRARGSSMPAMLAAGTAWGIAALTDPTFYATAALAGQSRGSVVPAVLVMVWFLISQLPLLAVTVTYLINSEGPRGHQTRRADQTPFHGTEPCADRPPRVRGTAACSQQRHLSRHRAVPSALRTSSAAPSRSTHAFPKKTS